MEEAETIKKEAIESGPKKIPAQTLEAFEGDELRARVFIEKYALHDEEGKLVEQTPREMWSRVARELASVEETPENRLEWQTKFYWLLEDFRFVPGGRILHGAGNKRKVSLLNCYVMPIKDDSIEAIYDAAKETARTYSYGGGVGIDISVLRPKGARVHNAAKASTGAVSFMELYSWTTGTIGQAARRGALMLTIADHHPDVIDFIEIKHNNTTKVRYANISVRISDKLMKAVENDEDFELRFENEVVKMREIVKARELWQKLVTAARDSAEPGLIFWDNSIRFSTSEYNGMNITTTNPCSEIPLEPYGCCCLGNVNLAKFVASEFTSDAAVDWQLLEPALRYATRFLDNVLAYSAPKHPLEEQSKASLWSRRIGVGFTGLGDMLCMLGLKYDSDEAIDFVDKLFERMKVIVYDESVNLAIEKDVFPAFDLEKHLQSEFIKSLPQELIERIKKHGLRNVALLTVPPVGSGAVLAGTTSGVEPIFALSYLRRSESLSKEMFSVSHPLLKLYTMKHGVSEEKQLPAFFVTAHQIKPEMRVRMQAAIQKHIDHSISSTVNLPHDVSVEEVSKIYFLAWKMGCKGITVYREGSREGILITEEFAKSKERQAEKVVEKIVEKIVAQPMRRKLPSERKAITHKFYVAGHEGYITTGMYDDGSLGEIFITMNKEGSVLSGLLDSFATSISIALQYGVPLKGLANKFINVRFEPSGVTSNPEIRFAKSIIDYLFKWLALKFLSGEDLEELGVSRAKGVVVSESQAVAGEAAEIAREGVKPIVQETIQSYVPKESFAFDKHADAPICPNCGSITVRHKSCYLCINCGTTTGCS